MVAGGGYDRSSLWEPKIHPSGLVVSTYGMLKVMVVFPGSRMVG
jgi:hypothetical protein